MTNLVYDIYKSARDLLKEFEDISHPSIPEDEFLNSMKSANALIEKSHPEFPRRYEEDMRMTSSFTRQQQDWICFQIGEWYLTWKNKMVSNGGPNIHRLGVAKEQLKTMLCGDKLND